DVAMENEAEATRAERDAEDAPSGEPCREGPVVVDRRALEPHVDHVRLGTQELDSPALERREGLGELVGAAMVAREVADVVLERVEPAYGEDPRLPQSSAEELAKPARHPDRLRVAHEEGSGGGAEPLRDAEHERVGGRRVLADRDGACDRRVEDPGSVDMEAKLAIAAEAPRGLEVLERQDPAAAEIARLLEDEEARDRLVDVVRANGRRDVLERDRPSIAGKRAALHSPETRGPGALERVAVRARVDDHLVARSAERADRDRVAHGARRNEEARLLAGDLGRLSLELRDRGIVSEDVVPERRGRHRREHVGIRAGDR